MTIWLNSLSLSWDLSHMSSCSVQPVSSYLILQSSLFYPPTLPLPASFFFPWHFSSQPTKWSLSLFCGMYFFQIGPTASKLHKGMDLSLIYWWVPSPKQHLTQTSKLGEETFGRWVMSSVGRKTSEKLWDYYKTKKEKKVQMFFLDPWVLFAVIKTTH